MKQLALDIGLATEQTLHGFHAGPNQAVLQHMQTWLAQGNTVRSSVPTYLWGEAGSGKSHLLHAVKAELEAHGGRVGWLHPGTVRPVQFDDRWVAVLFDDVHRYSTVQQTAAFNWFVNAVSPVTGLPKPVMAAGQLPPADLPVREDLRSRFGWGHVFQLQVLDDHARRMVLQQEAQARGVVLGDDVMDYMLNRFSRDLGSLMHLLGRLDAYALQTQRVVSIPLLKSMLESSP